jgi:hypothetical protein
MPAAWVEKDQLTMISLKLKFGIICLCEVPLLSFKKKNHQQQQTVHLDEVLVTLNCQDNEIIMGFYALLADTTSAE